MPTYEFSCLICSHDFEVFQKISDPAPESCPACGQKDLRKKIFAVSSIFKGDGFYTTNYRSEGYKEAMKQDGAPASTPASASDQAGSKQGSEQTVSASPGPASATAQASSEGKN